MPNVKRKRKSPTKGESPLPDIDEEEEDSILHLEEGDRTLPQDKIPWVDWTPAVRNPPILQTTPQKQAFSQVLRIMNSVNEGKMHSEEELKRLNKKLLKLLNRAKKDKTNLVEAHEAAIKKIRRELEVTNDTWGKKCTELNTKYAEELRQIREELAIKNQECHKLRSRNEQLSKENTEMVDSMHVLERKRVDEIVQLKKIVLDHESNFMSMIQKQSDDASALVQAQLQQNNELRVQHEHQIESIEKKYNKSMDEIRERSKNEIESLRVQLQAAGEERMSLQADHSAESSNLRQQLDAATAEIVAEKQACAKLNEIIDATCRESEELKSKMTKENLVSKGTISQLNEQLSHFRKEMENAKQENTNLKNYVQNLQRECKDKVDALEDRCEAIRQKLIRDIDIRNEKIAQLEAELDKSNETLSLSMKLQNETRNLEAKYRTDSESSRKDLEILKIVTDVEKKELEKTIQKIEGQIQESNEALALALKLEQETRDLERTYKQKAEILAKECERLKAAAVDEQLELKQMISKLETKLAQSNKANIEAREMIEDLKGELVRMQQEHVTQVSSLQDDNESSSSSSSLDERLRNYEKAEATLVQRIDSLENELQEKNIELLAAQEHIWKFKHEKAAVEDELSSQLMSAEAANNAEVEVLKQYTAQLEVAIEGSSASLSQAKARQMELVERLEELQAYVQSVAGAPQGFSPFAGKENNGESPIDSKIDRDDSFEGISELKRSLFAADNTVETPHGGWRRADDSSILEESFLHGRSTTGKQHIIPFEDPNERPLIDLDGSVEMEGWRERCYFLEHDRDELTRVTDEIMEQEKELHRLELEAAAESARREALDERREIEEFTSNQVRNLVGALCKNCRAMIYNS